VELLTSTKEPEENLMTEDRLPIAELLAKSGDDDFLRSVAEAVLQIIMEADVEGLIGAGRHERSAERTTWRNGLSYDFPRLLCDKGAAARHPKYAGQRRGTDREWVGHLGPCGSVIAPVFSHDLNG
jgi:hypothetical protein